MRSAIALSLGGGVDPFIAVKFAVAMQGFWILRGYSTEGRKLVQAALALPAIQASPVAQACALYVGAALAESQSDHAEARKMLETCLDAAARAGQRGRHRRDAVDAVDGPPAGRRCGRGAPKARARRCRSSGASTIASAKRSACSTSARSACTRATTRRARAHLEQCLAIAREIRHQEVEGECELVLGEVAFEAADLAQALPCASSAR